MNRFAKHASASRKSGEGPDTASSDELTCTKQKQIYPEKKSNRNKKHAAVIVLLLSFAYILLGRPSESNYTNHNFLDNSVQIQAARLRVGDELTALTRVVEESKQDCTRAEAEAAKWKKAKEELENRIATLKKSVQELSGESNDADNRAATNNQAGPEQISSTRAVIHMGIHKTGSTSIQISSDKFQKQLELDGYEMPWVVNIKRLQNGQGWNNQVHFSTCFLSSHIPEAQAYPCNPDLLLAGSNIATRHRNLFVSAETFDNIQVDGIKSLRHYLSQWDGATVVVYYRHYYSWVASIYNEITRSADPQHYKTIMNYVQQHMLEGAEYYPDIFATPLVKRLQTEFDDIIVLNLHDKSKGGASESFFCHSLSDFPRTCGAIRNDNEEHGNSSVDIDHIHLTNAAIGSGLLESGEDYSHILELVKDKFSAMKKEGYEFKKKCLSPGVLDKLWNMTLGFKRDLFPDDMANANDPSMDEANMRSDFEQAAVSSLCMLDVDDVFSRTDLQEYFKSLKN